MLIVLNVENLRKREGRASKMYSMIIVLYKRVNNILAEETNIKKVV